MKKLGIVILLLGFAVGMSYVPASAQPMTQAQKRELFMKGAQLWPLYCNTCHNARPGSEKAPYEWDAIIMHMHTLGNLPNGDAQALLEYLKSGR